MKKTLMKFMLCLSMAAGIVVTQTGTAFADDDVFTSTASQISGFRLKLLGITGAIAALLIVVTAIKMMAGDDRDTQAGKKRIVIILLCLVIANLAPSIVNWVNTTTGDENTVKVTNNVTKK